MQLVYNYHSEEDGDEDGDEKFVGIFFATTVLPEDDYFIDEAYSRWQEQPTCTFSDKFDCTI